tara:strand:+ start:442 stop:1227 length:786 start_codon:yes stop_codon:yes gene_type:complete
MISQLNSEVEYTLPLYETTQPSLNIELNQLIGRTIKISFSGIINCVVTGKKIRKAYGEGMSYDAFKSSPLAVESIIRPELSKIHLGVALRDYDWEMEHHMKPHIVYLSKTAGNKVGVTKESQIPTRWIDQGAIQALIIARVPYRQAAGAIEISLKKHISDKTNWRKMLQNEINQDSLLSIRDELFSKVENEYRQYLVREETLYDINFPVIKYPEKVKSLTLDKVPEIEEKLVGIKGQYLLFENDLVFNVRRHSGYLIELSY